MIGLLALIIFGGTAAPTSVFAVARHLVYRQTDPARGEAYLAWFREEKKREELAAYREQLAAWQRTQRTAPAPRPRELTYR